MSDELPLYRSEVEPIVKGSTLPWRCRVGAEGCTRDKPCPSCLGRRNRRSGLVKQRTARKRLGVPDAKFHGQLGNEESWRGVLRAEVKSGAQVKAMATRYLAAEKQAEANRAIGDLRPFCFVAMPSGMSDGLVCVRLSVWEKVIVPCLSD